MKSGNTKQGNTTMTRPARNDKPSTKLVGFFVTENEKKIIEAAKRIVELEKSKATGTAETLSMSEFIRTYTLPACKIQIMKGMAEAKESKSA
jgi:hypothetical protein